MSDAKDGEGKRHLGGQPILGIESLLSDPDMRAVHLNRPNGFFPTVISVHGGVGISQR